jgi:hypothetical protein
MNAATIFPQQQLTSFDDVKAMLKELAIRMKETDRRMKETDKKIGKLGNRIGDIIESIMTNEIHNQFRKFGYNFTKTSRNIEMVLKDGKALEVDAFVENGDYALAIEVKTKLQTEDINYHIQRMEKLRQYADDRNDKRKYIGAVASPILSENVKEYAFKCGFYVIEVNEDTAKILKPESFTPHIW